MEIWLKQEGNRFQIPILPSEYTVTSTQNNTPVTIHALGEINLLGKSGLREISFSSFFSKKNESYCEYRNFPSPEECVARIEKIKRKGQLKFLMTGTGIQMDCTIESFEYGENDGTGDISYTLTLKEYIILQIPKSDLGANEPADEGEGRSEKDAEGTETYIVKKGDCLSSIARAKTGSASNWKKIYEDNREVIGADPNRIYPGQVLMIYH